MNISIEWIEIPQFKVLENDGNWNIFETILPGSVFVNDILVIFPKGWITDFTSSPVWARGLVSQLGPHSPAALLHDRLLVLGYERKFARSVMKKQLELLPKVNKLTAFWMYFGVFGYDCMLSLRKLV